MAQYNANTSDFLGQAKTLFEVNMLATESGDVVTSTNRLPVDIGNTTINISGNVNVISPEVVTVNSTPENPVHVHITEIGNTDLTNFSYMPVQGNVVITSGNVVISSGNVAVTGSVNVGNFPPSQNVVIISSTSAPALVKYADSYNTQLDAVGRLRVAPPTQSFWYTPSVDKDGDLRYQEAFQDNANSYFIQNLAQVRVTSGNTYNANTSLTGYATRVSRRRFPMRPNVSLEWFAAMNWSGAETNVTKRRGFYTQFNGIFFEVSNGDISFNVRRRLEDGTIEIKTIPRSEWNVDRMDGTNNATNPTGYNINPATSAQTVTITGVASKSGPVSPQNSTEAYYTVVFNTSSTASLTWQLGQHVIITGLTPTTLNGHGMVKAITANTVSISYLGDPGNYSSGTGTIYSDGMYTSYSWWIDFDGSRTNRIRFGIQGASGPQVCHIEDFTSLLGTRWSNAPALPDRMEMFNTGSVAFNPAMFAGSSAINTEAELQLNPGFGTAYSNIPIPFATANTTVEKAILGVGLRYGEPYQRADLQVQGIDIIDAGNQDKNNTAATFRWRLLLNPTILTNDATPVNVGKASQIWDYPANTTYSGGIELLSGMFSSEVSSDIRTALNFLNMGSNVNNTSADKVVLVARQVAAGSSAGSLWGVINFIEAL
jgi:lipopolysaccharide export system protein LptA